MPQFDTFIFSSILFYFISFYLVFLMYNINRLLPKLSALIKFRNKLRKQKVSPYQAKFTISPTFLKFTSFIVRK